MCLLVLVAQGLLFKSERANTTVPTQVYSIASPISAAVSPPSNASAPQGEAGTTDEENPMRESAPPRVLPGSVECRGGGVASPTAARGAAGGRGGGGGAAVKGVEFFSAVTAVAVVLQLKHVETRG